MDGITAIGIDLAKSVFRIRGVREDNTVALRRKLRRGQVLAFFAACPPCLVGLEARAGAHYRARELIAPGHDVRIMPFFATNAPPGRSLDARTLRQTVCRTGEDRR